MRTLLFFVSFFLDCDSDVEAMKVGTVMFSFAALCRLVRGPYVVAFSDERQIKRNIKAHGFHLATQDMAGIAVTCWSVIRGYVIPFGWTAS